MQVSTIAAVASPPGVGAVALIRISGPDAAKVAAQVFAGRPSSRWRPRCQHWGRLIGPEGEGIDEGLLTYFPGPKSFTGEDIVEIGCHGGMLVTRRVLEAIFAAGAEPAAPGAFSQRAFLNGRIDLTQAEAIMDLISAQTDLAIRAAGEQLAGRLGIEVERIRKDLIGLLAHVEAYIDFPEEDIEPDSMEALISAMDQIAGKLDHLLATAEQGRILREGIRTVICGPPNAGKSSLLNGLLGFDRAIVSDLAGTTRDTIEEFINLKGIPLRLIDTAGIREGAEAIEREGIQRTRAQIAGAELILHVVDAHESRDMVEEIQPVPGARFVRVLNKEDLPRHADWLGVDGYPVSCVEPESIEAFREHLHEMLTAGTGLATASLTAINARHQACLKRARCELGDARGLMASGESPEFVAAGLHAALHAVGEVIGRTDIEEILGEIFSRFCIGK
jgi:tRNA modification GTPase